METKEIQRNLESLKKKAQELIQEKSRKEGQLSEIQRTFKENFGLKSTKEVQTRIKELEKEIKTIETDIECKYNAIVEELKQEENND